MAAPGERLDTILLATDGSDYSRPAEAVTLWLAQGSAAGVIVLQAVLGDTGYPVMVPATEHAVVKDAREYVESVCLRMQDNGIACRAFAVPAAEPFRAIVDRAAQDGVGLIVMGRRNRSDLSRLMMGDNTARVIGHAHCPVLVVPRGATAPWHGIVVATDGSDFSERAVKSAVSLSRLLNIPLRVITVVTGSESDPDAGAARRIAEGVKAASGNPDTLVECAVERGRPEDVIVAYANRHGADLVVVGSHGRSGIARLLVGSVSERVVGHFGGAVMVVR